MKVQVTSEGPVTRFQRIFEENYVTYDVFTYVRMVSTELEKDRSRRKSKVRSQKEPEAMPNELPDNVGMSILWGHSDSQRISARNEETGTNLDNWQLP